LIYVAGLFAMGYTDLYIFLIPLYGLSLGMSAGEIGMLVGGRSLLPVFLFIHVGTLMDRLGTRRVKLFFVWTAMALAPVFPLVPWFWPLLLLQVVNGGALSFAWSGSQTLIAQLTEGEAEYISRFSFFARIGTTVAPILAGVAWDCGGAWPSYLLGFAWGIVLTLALLRAPEADIVPRDGAAARRTAKFWVRDVLPRLPDYIHCRALQPGFGRRPSPDDEPACSNRDTARNGRNRRPMGRRIELSDPRHRLAGTVGAGRADHPPRHAPRRSQPASTVAEPANGG
jgi:MFS family permease